MSREEENKLRVFEEQLIRLQRIARDKKLSLSAKGLMIVLKEVVPYIGNKDDIKELCNSDDKEIYSALCELADNGYISFKDIASFLGHHFAKEISIYDKQKRTTII